MERPLVKWFLSAAGGLSAAYYLAPTSNLIWMLGALIIILIIVIVIKSVARTNILILLLIFSLFLFYLQVVKLDWQQSKMKEVLGQEIKFSGIITEVINQAENKKYIIKKVTNLAAQQQYDYKVELRVWQDKTEFELGDKILFTTRLKYPSRQKNPGGFSYRKYLQKEGIYAVGNVNSESIVKISDSNHLFINIVNSLRSKIEAVIAENFSGQKQNLISALLLGEKENLTTQVSNSFKELGISHLLVISGFHIGLISYLIYSVMNYLGCSLKINIISLSLILCFYLAIINWQLPAGRATLLVILTLIAKLLGRRVDLYNILSGTALLLLILNPWSLFTISFQLSFTAVVMISYLSPLLKKLFLFLPNKIREIITATLAVQIGLFPILIYYFNQISVLSILANLLIMPMISLMLFLLLFLLLGSAVYFPGLGVLVGLIKTLLNSSLNLAQFLADNYNLIFSFPSLSIISVVIYYILGYYLFNLIAGTRIPYNKDSSKKIVIVLLILVIVIVTVGFEQSENLELVFLAVGLGDGAYLKTPRGQNVLIDGGSSGRQISNLLQNRGIANLDLIFISHFHKDHAQGIVEVLKKFRVDKICYPSTVDNKLQDEINKVIKEQKQKTEKIVLTAGDQITIDQVEFLVLHPRSKLITKEELNNNSLVLKMLYKKFAVLFTGDIEKEGEGILIDSGVDLKADILKVAHHGSASSSTTKFLQRVQPYLSVMSVGENNYGLPDRSVIFKLKKLGIKNLRTDKRGAVKINSNGQTYKYQLYLD